MTDLRSMSLPDVIELNVTLDALESVKQQQQMDLITYIGEMLTGTIGAH